MLSKFKQLEIANKIVGQSLTLALSKSNPMDDGVAISEPVGGYARQSVTFTNPVFVDGIGTKISTAVDIVYGAATETWGTITHWALFGSIDGYIASGEWLVPKLVQAGDGYAVPAGGISLYFR